MKYSETGSIKHTEWNKAEQEILKRLTNNYTIQNWGNVVDAFREGILIGKEEQKMLDIKEIQERRDFWIEEGKAKQINDDINTFLLKGNLKCKKH